MSVKNTSRFDFLLDDAGDPFETVSKKNKKKNTSSADASQKKTGKKGSTNSDKKQLQTLAFGSASEGKKKGKGPSTNGHSQQQNGNPNSSNNSNGNGSSDEKEFSRSDGAAGGGAKSASSAADFNHGFSKVPGDNRNNVMMQRPKGISKEQWEQWQKRDTDIMDETYASDLQTALLQSKLEYESELKNKPVSGKGKKKKPVAVPLTEFNARLTEGTSSAPPHPTIMMNANGGVVPPRFLAMKNFHHQPPPSGPPPPPAYVNNDEDLVEKFRQEARLEIERERQLALERQMLMNRKPPPPIARPTPAQLALAEAAAAANSIKSSTLSSSSSFPYTSSGLEDEKDVIIRRLSDENMRCKGEISLLKEKIKAINNYLQAAQDIKDKAKLLYEMENLTKTNSDLHEELRQAHSQLEQERSRSSQAMLELRRVLENRRRTNTEGST